MPEGEHQGDNAVSDSASPDAQEMRMSANDFAERQGVALANIAAAFELKWIFREQTTSDYGVDAQLEIVEGNVVTGRLIALQIKSGPSYQREWHEDNAEWTFRSDTKHLNYWLGHVMPVVVLLADPATRVCYWQVVSEQTIRRTDNGFALTVPQDHILDGTACEPLIAVAERRDESAAARYEHNLTLLSNSVQVRLARSHSIDPIGSARLADVLVEGRSLPALTTESLVNGQPSYLTQSPDAEELWCVLGDYALGHDVTVLGGEAFLLAAEVNGARSAQCRALGGVLIRSDENLERSLAELDRAKEEGAELLASAGKAMVQHPVDSARPIAIPERVAAASAEELDAEPMVLMFLGQHYETSGDAQTGLEYFERALGLLPHSHGPKLAIANLLMRHVALRGTGGGLEVRRARQLIEESIQEVRRWDGPSELALRQLLHLQMSRAESSRALLAASPAPIGTARPREAADPEVAATGALAALHLSRPDDHQRFLEAIGEHPRRLMIDGWRAALQDDDDAAIVAWSAALEAVDDDGARSQCVSFLARLGRWPAAAAADLKARGVLNDEMFDILRATSITRSDFDEGIYQLRALSELSHLAAIALVQAIQVSGTSEAAIAECEVQMTRWTDASIPVMCADLLRQEGREEDARVLIENLLSRVELSDDLKHSFRRWLIHFYGGRGLWEDVTEIAALALSQRPEDQDVGWNYLIALSNLGRVEDARTALRTMSLVPVEYDEIRLWIRLHFGIPWSEVDVTLALELAARQTGDPRLAVLLVSLAAREAEMHETTFSAPTLQSIEDAKTSIGIDPRVVRSFGTDATQLDELTQDGLRQDAAAAAVMVAHVREGSVPLGRLSSRLRIPYAQSLVQKAAGVIVASSDDDIETEVESARRCLHQTWVVDSSALYVSSLLGQAGARLRALAAQLLAVRAAANDALRGRDVVRVETSSELAMRYNPGSHTFERTTVSPEDAAELRRRAAELERLIQGCTLRPAEASLPGVGPFDDAWAATVDLAKAEECPLYSDDVALRRMARAQGVASFGTHALLRVASELPGHEAAQFDRALRKLIAECVVDLPADLPAVIEQAAEDQWTPGPALELLGRSAWWKHHDSDDWQALLVASGSPAVPVHWVNVAISATLPQYRPDERATAALEMIAASLAAAYFNGGRECPYEITELIDGSFLHDVVDNRFRLIELVGARLNGHVQDPFGAAATIVGGAMVLGDTEPSDGVVGGDAE